MTNKKTAYITLTEATERISAETGLKKYMIKRVIISLEDGIYARVINNQVVVIHGFGKFMPNRKRKLFQKRTNNCNRYSHIIRHTRFHRTWNLSKIIKKYL